MSDSIDRQEAVDGLWSLDIELRPSAIDAILNMLKGLPPAQPEIIKCKDCIYGSPNSKYGCKCYHYKLYETHLMKPEDFCSYAERRQVLCEES